MMQFCFRWQSMKISEHVHYVEIKCNIETWFISNEGKVYKYESELPEANVKRLLAHFLPNPSAIYYRQ